MPFEVQLGVVEGYVGAQQVGRGVGGGPGGELPIERVTLVGPLEPAHPRPLGAMARRQVEVPSRSRLVPALLDELGSDGIEALEPVVRD